METLYCLGTRVNESEAMRLSGLKPEFRQTCVGNACGPIRKRPRTVKISFAVDEIVVRSRWANEVLNIMIVRVMVPVRLKASAPLVCLH